jgi:hypothetical protein
LKQGASGSRRSCSLLNAREKARETEKAQEGGLWRRAGRWRGRRPVRASYSRRLGFQGGAPASVPLDGTVGARGCHPGCGQVSQLEKLREGERVAALVPRPRALARKSRRGARLWAGPRLRSREGHPKRDAGSRTALLCFGRKTEERLAYGEGR